MQIIPASITSFLVTCTMLFALRPFAEGVGLIDKPGGRKTHKGEVPVIGGLAMYVGLLVAVLGGATLRQPGADLVLVAAFMVVLGALDDRFNLPPRVRLFAHLSAAVAVIYTTGFVVHDLGDLLGFGSLALGPFALPFTVVAIVALINAFNMLDGLDGLAGSVGLVAICALTIIASAQGASGVVLVASAAMGAVGAFLLFNLPVQLNRPMRTFMGDAGSTLLGFLLAALSLRVIHPVPGDLNPIVVLWLMPIPIFELFSSTTRRIIRGMSPAEADTGHFHHRLVAAGCSVRAICALYFVVSVASCAAGIQAWRNDLPEPLMFAGFCVFFGAWTLMVRLAPRFVTALPLWFRRIDMKSEH